MDVGTYTVTVRDQNQCEKDTTITITQPNAILSAFNTILNPLCFDSCNGTATIQVVGGISPYTYAWANGGAGNPNTQLCNGKTLVTITDANLCEKLDSVILVEPLAVSINLASANPTCFNTIDGAVIPGVTGGTPGYSYMWSNGANTQSIQNLPAGNYSLTATDIHGCKDTAQVTLIRPDSIEIFTSSVSSTCHHPDGSATVDSIHGDGVNYTYLWDANAGSQTTATANALVDDCYQVTVTDNFGCNNHVQVCVGLIPGPTISSTQSTAVSCYGGLDGMAFTMPQGGTLPYAFGWSNLNTNDTIKNIPSGWYYVTVVDAHLCEAKDSVEVLSPSQIIASAHVAYPYICADSLNIFSGTATGGTAPYTFHWNDTLTQTSFSFHPEISDIFYVVATDANGCNSEKDTAEFNFFPKTTVQMLGDDRVCRGQGAALEALISGGKGTNFTYLWSDGQTTQQINTMLNGYPAPTMYSVIASAGCENDTAKLSINYFIDPVVKFSADVTKGCPPFEVSFSNNTDKTFSCEWSFGNGQISNNSCTPTMEYTKTGCYDISLKIYTTDGCAVDSAIDCFIRAGERPHANFRNEPDSVSMWDPEITFYNTSTFDSVPIVGWHWVFPNGSDETNDTISYLLPGEKGRYPVVLYAYNEDGCYDTITKWVSVFPEFSMYAPNTFTPDGDGINDVFAPVVTGLEAEDYELRIFNRWGVQVFESFKYEKKWDGTTSGLDGTEPVKEGTYIWKLYLRDATIRRLKEFNGYVNVLRHRTD